MQVLDTVHNCEYILTLFVQNTQCQQFTVFSACTGAPLDLRPDWEVNRYRKELEDLTAQMMNYLYYIHICGFGSLVAVVDELSTHKLSYTSKRREPHVRD